LRGELSNSDGQILRVLHEFFACIHYTRKKFKNLVSNVINH
jgi:hypothetical protein